MVSRVPELGERRDNFPLIHMSSAKGHSMDDVYH
jgi:hypothetical protein